MKVVFKFQRWKSAECVSKASTLSTCPQAAPFTKLLSREKRAFTFLKITRFCTICSNRNLSLKHFAPGSQLRNSVVAQFHHNCTTERVKPFAWAAAVGLLHSSVLIRAPCCHVRLFWSLSSHFTHFAHLTHLLIGHLAGFVWQLP